MISFNCNCCCFILLIFPILAVSLNYSDCGIGVEYPISRIFHGQIAGKHQYPWMAFISFRRIDTRQDAACSGFLIDSSHVITARHCVGDEMKVYLGMNNYNQHGESTTIEVNSIWKPEEKPDTKDDIAILTLSKSIEFSESIRPICLPKSDDEFFESLTAIGFGRTEIGHSGVLKHVQVDFISRPECQKMIDDLPDTEMKIDDVTMCAVDLTTGGGACSGDSGGPLMYKRNGRYFAVGIAARTINSESGQAKCGYQEEPVLYTIVSKYRDTIIQIAKEAQFRDY